MRFLHLADLHIGKRLREFSLLQDQEDILTKILDLVAIHHPDAVLICGDIYDKSDPSAEAVEVFDQFLTGLAQYGQPVMLISGNHDSPERINYGSGIMEKQQVYLAGLFEGQLQTITLADEYGEVVFHLLPFVKPAQVRRYYPEANIISYEDALQVILSATPLDPDKRHVLLAHQFITAQGVNPERSESEQISIGTLDNIDASVFAGFDYVALGHIHRPQSIGGMHIRYAGSPLKYSFSEALHHKSATLVELLVSLRNIYPNIVTLDFNNSRYATADSEANIADISNKSPLELFAEFYAYQQNIELGDSKRAIVQKIFQEMEEKH